MGQSFIEQQIENAVLGRSDDRLVSLARGISRLAAKQGGESTAHNYQLLGKRVLIVAGVVVVAVQAVSYVIARRSEEQRIERVVRRVLDEEKNKSETEA